ncbi:MAG: glycosyltransferase family 9 protein [Anaerolineae bacterium]|nr:glycosyltransferase family 9 protein [Anaerolineae bacterium]
MDREALVLRNRAMAQAFHKLPLKHQLRRRLLTAVAKVRFTPIPVPKVERILLIRPDHLGDVLLTTPAIRALYHARPFSEIHTLVGPWSAQVLANYHEIDQVLTLPFPGFSRNPKETLRSPYELALSASRMLRRIGYTSAVILRPDHWWGALLAHLAGIPQIIGYDLPDTAPFLTDKLPYSHQHVILQNLRLVEYWTGTLRQRDIVYHFPIDPMDKAYIDGYLDEWGVLSKVICIHCGSGTFVKQWESEKWAMVADTLAEQLNATIVLTGSDAESGIAQQIAAVMQQRPCIIAGDTNIGQLAALFARALVVLGADSGPLHLAAAVGAPTVTLYGPADPVEFGTWGISSKNILLMSEIGCRPCGILDWSVDDPAYHPCVKEITVGRVLEAARRAAHFEE